MKKTLDKIEDAYWFCRRMIRNFFSPFWYRFFGHKHHIIRTGLTPSPWYDVDSRMLYGMMNLVKWFVENDARLWSDEDLQEELDRIDKEEAEEYKKSHKEAIIDQVSTQREIEGIYKWWEDYPRRQKEIDDALTEWADFSRGEKKDGIPCFQRAMTEEEKVEEKKMLKRLDELEQKLQEEEQKYLIRAVELRSYMWS